MARSRISINLNPILGALTALERDNLPFAQAVALNNTAFKAKAALVAKMPDRFDLRSPRVAKGFRVDKANKKQPIPTATVFHLDAWMSLHETGGTKHPTKGRSMGVPAAETQRKGRAPSGKIRERWWPRNLGKNAGFADPTAAGRMGGRGKKGKGPTKAFIMTAKNGDRTIVRRTSRKAGSRDGSNRWDLIDLYYLKKEVRIRPHWGFVDTVHEVAAENLGPEFKAALAQALASSRR